MHEVKNVSFYKVDLDSAVDLDPALDSNLPVDSPVLNCGFSGFGSMTSGIGMKEYPKTP